MVTGRRKEKLEATVSLCEAEGATKDRVSYIQGETISLCQAEGATEDRVSYIQGVTKDRMIYIQGDGITV